MKEKKLSILTQAFAIYAGAMIAQNVLAAKQIDVLGFTVTTGILLSPFIFVVQDVISEIFGFKTARKMIVSGMIVNLVAVLLFTLAILIPPSVFWENQQAFAIILSTTLRITIASNIAYFTGSILNSFIITKRKDKHKFFSRAMFSTLIGQFLDNALFSIIAFLGILPTQAIISMIVGATIFEVAYEFILFPLIKAIVNKLNKYLKK